jgi:Spy/CpxP family protein refolding chaperone
MDTSSTTRPSRRLWFAGLAALGGLGVLGAAAAQGVGVGRLDPEERARRMEWRISRFIANVGGTPDQKDRLVAIAHAAAADIAPLRDQERQARRQGLQLLTSATVDRAALETTRAAGLQAADARSRRLVQALADAADVLTPDQRTKAAQQMMQRMNRWR